MTGMTDLTDTAPASQTADLTGPPPVPETGPLAEISARIKDAQASLSPQLRQAARYVLAHPEEVALTSMRRLADHAGVKPSTMVRLARGLGFDGYESFREPYRMWLRGGEGAFVARARTLQARAPAARGSCEPLLDELARADSLALSEALTGTNGLALQRTRDLIRDARTVYVVGMRSCFALAYFFHYAYGFVCGNAVLVDGHAGTMLDKVMRAGEGDVVLAIGFRPYTEDTVRATGVARGKGAEVVAVTDSLVSPLADGARETIVVDTASPSYFQSLVPALAQIQALLALLVVDGGEDALESLTRTEQELEASAAYWREPKRRRRHA
ncbi:MurR/RpiR family transcriptional regulator [uncultured Rhodospira sp.]|uniref:MurR/RpiR family transcriptional regulator n=1 Tax=uncultured Rhodospira sp. TaxID=1936189 RepID=UPI00262C367A|nr:MurR/RpiR family transcriptional regulator [uncultured Rhodospira sp.]